MRHDDALRFAGSTGGIYDIGGVLRMEWLSPILVPWVICRALSHRLGSLPVRIIGEALKSTRNIGHVLVQAGYLSIV